ncbi:unnamed protein product [Staurois parvus]|uniref:Uncharacterized protein n=1 Tax=Staurois parvus TaxID=386267 RepID=A0ABN9GIE5_9NEOB|nr:unnamed protein product [Staurois parvus]
MMDNQPPLTSPDGSSHGNPPERCPRPLYSQDSTQEDHTIPHHHQGEELKDIKAEIKEEEEEMLVSGDQQSMEEGVLCIPRIAHRKKITPSLTIIRKVTPSLTIIR